MPSMFVIQKDDCVPDCLCCLRRCRRMQRPVVVIDDEKPPSIAPPAQRPWGTTVVRTGVIIRHKCVHS